MTPTSSAAARWARQTPLATGLMGAGKLGSMFLNQVLRGPLVIRDHAGE